jgi:thymidylate synthase (FAD)
MKRSEEAYKTMIEYGCKPQEARDVLPKSVKTEVIMTGTIGQWKEMLILRLDNAAHPQMRLVAGMFKELAESKGYDFR